MEKKTHFGFLALMAVVLVAVTSCRKPNKYEGSPIVGHWGCEHRGYEVYFNADGSGRLLLNDSPALIKKFNCNYDYNSANQILTIYNTSWIISTFSDATSADMVIEEITDTNIVASWTNYFSEPEPFFERFFLNRIN